MNRLNGLRFGELFKKFRLKSQFKTLSQLSDTLTELNLFYEESIFSRWEHGNRIPKSRDVLLSLIKLFIERGGITNLNEVNDFLEAAGQGYLTESEIKLFSIKSLRLSPFLAPRDIPYFTGRKKYLFSIRKKLLKGKIVLIYGLAGCGKTSLAIRLAHMLRGNFPDGILWFCLDTSLPINILTSIAGNYGEDISKMQDLHNCASYIRSLLSSKKVLIIFDNADKDSRLDLLLPNSKNNSVLITSRNADTGSLLLDERIYLSPFSDNEVLMFFEKILGKHFVSNNKKGLLEISELVSSLPLAISLIAQQMSKANINIYDVAREIKKRKIRLRDFAYENKNFYTAIEFSYKRLNNRLKKFFKSLSVFTGKDFSHEAVSYVNKIGLAETKIMLSDLINNSLLEYSSLDRYRLHPMIKYFLQNKGINKIYYERAINFYTAFLNKTSHHINYFLSIRSEIDNIFFLFEKCLGKFKFNDILFRFWREINKFLWFSGYWGYFYSLNKKIYHLSSESEKSLFRKYVCIDLSCVCYWLGYLNLAEKYAKEGLIVASSLNDKNFLAQAKDRLGKIYQLKNGFNKSIKYLRSAYNFFNKTNDYEKIGNVLRHIGEGYMYIKKFNKAEEYFNLALKKYLKIKDLSLRNMYQALINSHLGVSFIKQHKLITAKKLFIASLNLEKITGGRAGTKIGSKLGLGLIYGKMGQLNTAKKYFKEAKKEIEILGIKKEIEKLNVCMVVLKDDLLKNSIYRSIFIR